MSILPEALVAAYRRLSLGTKVGLVSSAAISATLLSLGVVGIGLLVGDLRASSERERAGLEAALHSKAELVSGLLARISVMQLMSQDLADLQTKAKETMRDSDFIEVCFLSKDGTPIARVTSDTTRPHFSVERKVVTDKESMGVEKEVGSLRIGVSTAQVLAKEQQLKASIDRKVRAACIGTLIAAIALNILLVALLIFVLRRRVSIPLAMAVELVEAVSQGELDRELNFESDDEIGHLARSLGRMNEYLRQTAHIADLVAAGDLTTKITPRSDRDRLGTALAKMNGALRDSMDIMRHLSDDMTSSSGTLRKVGESLLTEASGVSARAGDASQSSETVAANVRSVAAAAEEMSASIQEIARSAEGSRHTAGEALGIAKEATDRVQELSSASEEISRVTEVIVEIAEQTKLLALNATIEAARAGEAGKGFAVVASEVKELAKNTASATDDIRRRIELIQGSTRSTVSDIGRMREVMTRIEGAVASIAAAVEEQSVTTNEIVRNVADSSRLVQGITGGITEVASSSILAERGARDVLSSVSLVGSAAERLGELSRRFKT